MSVKTTLKKARELIDSKEYAKALNLTKTVLDDDPRNYMALIYAGLASQELKEYGCAEKFYKKSVKFCASNTLALHGLANFYDKWIECDDADLSRVHELLNVYKLLIQTERDPNKCLKVVKKFDRPKIIKLAFDDLLQTLDSFLDLEHLNNACKKSILKLILYIISGHNKTLTRCFDLYHKCYSSFEKDVLTPNQHFKYLHLLYKKGNYIEMFETYNILGDIKYADCIIDWLTHTFIEIYITDDVLYKLFYEHLSEIDFNKVQRTSEAIELTKLVIAFQKAEADTFDDILRSMHTYNGNYTHSINGWIVTAIILLQLQRTQDARNAISLAEKIIGKITIKKEIREKLKQLICLTYCKSNMESDLRRGITEGEAILNANFNENILAYVTEANLRLGDIKTATQLLEKFDKTSHAYVIANAHILKTNGQFEDAIKFLEKHSSDSMEYWLLLGDLYWIIDKTKSLVLYLKATKAKPNSYQCYQRLGRVYKTSGDLDKARRCYEKSIKINLSKTAGVALSEIYRKLGKGEENLNLLLSITTAKITSDNSWAFFQLGIQYFEQGSFQQAINALRLVIRIDSNNSFYWECLADCYFATGSYNASLKCYLKVLTLNPKSFYAKLQVANLNTLIGEYSEAIRDFELVLRDNSSYIPALKGIAETYFLLAKQHFKKQLYGLTRDCFQQSLNYAAKALHHNPNLSCCWKIAADCLYKTALLPLKYSFLMVAEIVNQSEQKNDDDDVLLSDDLLKVAIKVYCKALSYNQDVITIYHDLASCYIECAKAVRNTEEKNSLLNHALKIIQHCTSNSPTTSRHWNLLGCLFLQMEPKNYEFAQHAFIKAISLDRTNAVSWTNLGMLYLLLGELKLANEVFSHGQKNNPNYVNCWIGQALIAEASNMEESMDLFRHTMELSYHPEGTIGYANWVCKTLMTRRKEEDIYEIHNMHAIPVACDGLRWYTENNTTDACAWNMLGMLYERLGLVHSALDAYKMAGKRSDKSEAIVNLGRAFVTSGLFSEAINCYESIDEMNVNAKIGYALVLFKTNNYEDAYNVYESILEGKLDNKDIQSDLLVALASMVYMFQGPEPAKHLLFQSTQLETRSPWSLYAILSLGLLDEDLDLAKLAFDEIEKLPINEENLKHYANLLVYTFLIQDNYNTCISKLSTLVHKNPNSPSLWLELATLLYRLREVNPKYQAIDNCAKASLILRGNNPNLSRVLPIATATSILRNDKRNALKAAQQLVHYYPNNRIANEILMFTRSH